MFSATGVCRIFLGEVYWKINLGECFRFFLYHFVGWSWLIFHIFLVYLFSTWMNHPLTLNLWHPAIYLNGGSTFKVADKNAVVRINNLWKQTNKLDSGVTGNPCQWEIKKHFTRSYLMKAWQKNWNWCKKILFSHPARKTQMYR